MGTKHKLSANLLAFCTMLLGASLVFGMMIVMNRFVERPEATGGPSTVDFSVQKIKPKKKQQVNRVQPPRKRTVRREQPLAPLPDLGTEVSGIDVGIPEFDLSGLGNVSESLLGDLRDVIMTEDAVDRRPVARVRSGIVYPARARSRNITGYVTLSLLIGVDGRVKRVKVVEAEPQGIFEESTVAAVQSWVFEPATYKERNVEVWANQTINFRLN